MIGNLNHGFIREQAFINPEAQSLISEIKSLNNEINDKTTQHNAGVLRIIAKWDSDVNDFSESFSETEKELLELERSIDEALDMAILDFIDDEGVLEEVEQNF